MAEFRGRMWKGWEDEVRDAYEMGGKALGKFLVAHPHKEPEIWKLVCEPTGWPRRWLKGFRQMYRRENPVQSYKEMDKHLHRRRTRSQGCARKVEREQRAQKAATDEVGSALRGRRKGT